MATNLHEDTVKAITQGDHGAPFDVLGIHYQTNNTAIVRAFRPHAKHLMVVIDGNDPVEMDKLTDEGLFQAEISIPADDIIYQFKSTTHEGIEHTFYDPYNFDSLITDYDEYLFSEGRHWNIYEKLGAHITAKNGIQGVNFAVWAPNAKRVSVVGDFNNWDGRVHPMRHHQNSGIWELFIPEIGEDEKYKYEIKSHNRAYQAEKIDPYGFYAERRPNTASIVADIDKYDWQDDEYMAARESSSPLTDPMVIYEAHLGSWKRDTDGHWLNYRELADQLVSYVSEMGYTHIELLPVAEHPFDGSWGYQVTGYYAPTSRFGKPEDFMYFVDKCHQHDIGVILDWVPAHFPKDGHALSFFDGTHLYSHEDPRQGEHPDWGTYIFNYGRNEVRNFLIANALFWLEKYHIDGLRVDAVSSMIYLDFSREDGEWIPNEHGGNENLAAIEFLQEANHIIHDKFPGAMTIAEESTAFPMVSRPTYLGGLGFTFKWNMGWMHDTLFYMQKDPVYRRWEHNKLTFSLVYAFNENFVLSLSHDEVVHGKGSLMGKMPGDWWQTFAQMRLLFGYQYTHPGKKLNFMGAEIGQWSEWSEERSLDWHLMELDTHQKLNKWVKDLNHFYKTEPALYERDFDSEGFEWIEANDAANSVYSYIRYAKDKSDFVVIVANFTPIVRENYRVGVPQVGHYDEILNSDGDMYGGSNIGNYGGFHTDDVPAHNRSQSLNLRIPPLGILILKLNPDKS